MVRLVAVAAVAVISTACSPGQPAVADQHGPTAIRASATLPDAAPVAPPTPSSAPPTACPPPWGVCAASQANGNFDGKGQKEVFSVSPIRATSGAILDWLLEVDLADGRSVSARLSGLVGARGGCPTLDAQYAVALGAANFAGPSRDLAFVEINHGASTRFGMLVGIQAATLRLATVANGGMCPAARCVSR